MFFLRGCSANRVANILQRSETLLDDCAVFLQAEYHHFKVRKWCHLGKRTVLLESKIVQCSTLLKEKGFLQYSS
jgi:hypothetical protein